ncbi:MAG: DinB family protein [Bacteroidia bacterium]
MSTTILSFKAGSLLSEIKIFLETISNQVYAAQSHYIDNASIGQHTRHILEFYEELLAGYQTGWISYDKRKRNHQLETEREAAIQKINEICELLNKTDKSLTLEQNIISTGIIQHCVASTYERELIYNIEHTVHHMALIKVAAREKGVSYKLGPEFGYADSTILNKKTELSAK